MSASSFLEDLAVELCDQHRHHLHRLTIILPHCRAGEVFRQCLAAHLHQPAKMPKILSMATCIQQLSPLKQANSLLLTHMLWETFQTLQPREEQFERFYFWGSSLLEDFDVIDKYVVDATHLFTDLSKHKALSLSHDYLTEAQRTAIRSFWKNFDQHLSTHQKGFLNLWELLPKVYQRFKQRLKEQGIGYQGMCHRAAYEALIQGTAKSQYEQLVFAGFNALTPVEERILIWYQENIPTSFYWDIDAYYMEDTQQEAGLYLRTHQQKPYFQKSFVRPFAQRIAKGAQTIYIQEVASEVGQIHVIKEQLHALIKTKHNHFVPNKTAIIVANESLRVPVLHALSSLHKVPISIHLGYPLKNTTSYRLLEHLLALHIASSQKQCPPGYFATREVLTVLRHPHMMGWDPTQVPPIIDRLQASRRSYIAHTDLTQYHPLYAIIFRTLGPQDDLLQCVIDGLKCIADYAQEETIVLPTLEKIALQHILQQLDRLQPVLVAPAATRELLQQLLQQLMQPIQLFPDKQTTNGIQVLDVLAAQNLDFDHVFIVGMNEEHFPAQANQASFIPYNLRKGYGLPTADKHPAALYAYHFYRLLQRAQTVYITYSTQTVSSKQGEMSRYLWQLLYESKLNLKRKAVTHPMHLIRSQPIVIQKKAVVLQQLKKILLQSDGTIQYLTPSALNTYLDCSLRFYFQYLAQLKVPLAPQQATHALVFGTLLHMVMERLYTPMMYKKQGQPLQPQDLAAMKKRVARVVKDVFVSTFLPRQHQGVNLQGDNAIAQAVMVKLANRIVALDQAYAPFVLIGIEMGRQTPFDIDFVLHPTKLVRLRGIIDRVDERAGVFRVLDYKTGFNEKKIKSIASLFDRNVVKRNKAAFQTLFYAWLFHQKEGSCRIDTETLSHHQLSTKKEARVMPGILDTRQIFDDHFDSRFFLQSSESRTTVPIEDIRHYALDWEAGLRQTLEELFDTTVPFSQTQDEARCMTCPYKGICERH